MSALNKRRIWSSPREQSELGRMNRGKLDVDVGEHHAASGGWMSCVSVGRPPRFRSTFVAAFPSSELLMLWDW